MITENHVHVHGIFWLTVCTCTYMVLFILFSEVLSSATECLTELFEAIENELKEFCNKSNWLIQLNEYISTWEGKREGGEGFRTIKPEDIKVILCLALAEGHVSH